MGIVVTAGAVLTDSGVRQADVLIEHGRIARIAPGIDTGGHEVVEAGGCWVGPAFVDLHVHLREPGQEWKEDIASGRQAAVAGGYLTVVAMPNTDPPIDAGHVARQVWRIDDPRVIPAGAITLGRGGARLSHLDQLWAAGVRIFSDDGDTVADGGLLRRAMEYIAQLGGVVAQHAEDPGLCRDGHMHEGSVSSRLGMRGLPAAGEEVIVSRDIALVELTGCRYHVQHASTAGTVELVRRAKAAGLPVTAEVTPHHLALDHTSVLTMDPVYKMYPPLRTPDDVAALREALADGTIDAVATDHAPHAAFEKDVTFEEAPRGVIGLETAAAVVNSTCGLDQDAFFRRMSRNPSTILGEPSGALAEGDPARLVVFDPDLEWQVTDFLSKSSNSPWIGAQLQGRVRATLAEAGVLHRLEEVPA